MAPTLSPTDAALRQLATSVPVFTAPGQHPTVKEQLTSDDNSQARVFERSWTANGAIDAVLAWYQAKYPRPDGWSPLTAGNAMLMITSSFPDDTTAFQLLDQTQVQVRMSRTSPSTSHVTVTASGYPFGERTKDSYLPAGQIVSATISTVDDSVQKPTVTRQLLPAEITVLVSALNAAPIQPDMLSTSLAGGTTTRLTFVSSTGQRYRATYDSATSLAGTMLDFGAPTSRRLDLPSDYYQRLAELGRRN